MALHLHQIADNLNRAATTPGLVIDDQFHIVDKHSWMTWGGWKWTLLCLLKPFFSCLRGDVYSHYRVHNVAEAIFEACRGQQEVLQNDTNLQQSLLKGVQRLNNKTHQKYQDSLHSLAQRIEGLAQVPPPEMPKIPPKGLYDPELPLVNSADDLEMRWLTDEIKPAILENYWGISEEAFEIFKTGIKELVSEVLTDSGNRLEFVKEGEKGNRRRTLQVINAEGSILKTLETPCSLEPTYDPEGRLQDILLLTKYTVGRGGQTTVRLCFSLVHGNQYVRKNCSDEQHEQTLSLLPPVRGLVKVLGLRVNQIEGRRKAQVIEEFWSGNLSEFINKKGISPAAVRNQLIMGVDILSGIAALHGTVCPEHVLNDGTHVAAFKMFHKDLALSNILVNPPKSAVITDFGGSHPEILGGVPGFKSPEQVDLCLAPRSREEVVAYNIKYGQASDVWSAGLILAALFAWETTPEGDAPLRCIKDSLEKSRSAAGFDIDRNIVNLRQEEIDEDITALKVQGMNRATGPKLKTAVGRVWDLIGKMVRVDPAERISSQEALKILIAIQEQASLKN